MQPMNNLMSGLKKYRVLAIVGVFLTFFVVVGVLNYLQRVALENFENEMEHMQEEEHENFSGYSNIEGFSEGEEESQEESQEENDDQSEEFANNGDQSEEEEEEEEEFDCGKDHEVEEFYVGGDESDESDMSDMSDMSEDSD